MSKLILKSSFLVLILIVFGKILSFGRDIFISYKFGSSFKTDAYFAANNVPSILFTAILSSYIVLLTPLYKKIEINQGRSFADIFLSKLLNGTILVTLLMSSLGFVFISFFIDLVAPGFNVETKNMAINLGRILVLSFPFSAITVILATISTANNKFYATHIIPIFSSLFVIIGVWLLSGKYDIFSLAYAGVTAFMFQLLIQIYISKGHFKYTPIFSLNDEHLKMMTIAVLPVFLGFSIDQINLLINSILSSSLGVGSLSALNYAQRLQATITGTITTAVLTVIYPLLSKLNAEGRDQELVVISKKTIKNVSLIFIPLVAYISFNSKALVEIVYFRGNFTSEAVEETSRVFLFYVINVLLLSIREICLRLYYVKNDTKTPLFASILSMAINALLGYLLINYLGAAGLSLANLIATLISLGYLFIVLNSKISVNINIQSMLRFVKGIFIPVSIVSLFLYYQKSQLYLNQVFLFLIGFVITVLLYGVLLLLSKQPDAIKFYNLFKERYLKHGFDKK